MVWAVPLNLLDRQTKSIRVVSLYNLVSAQADLDIKEFFRLATGEISQPIYICSIDRDLSQKIGSTTCAVWLSKYTLDKQFHRHNEITADLYEHIPYVIQNGIVVSEKRNHLSFLLNSTETIGYWIKACVKSSRDGNELYLVTFHKCRKRDVERVLSKGIIIRPWQK